MFWKQRHRPDTTNMNPQNASEIVTQVGAIYIDLNEQGQLVKPRSSLPCAWFNVRGCFITAYEAEYLQLTEKVKWSYHHVYGELAFFVDDNLFNEFNTSLNVAAKCCSEQIRNGLTENEVRMIIASEAVKRQDRKTIRKGLEFKLEKTCPRHDLHVLAETLTYCGHIWRAMWDEWAAFEKLVAYRKRTH